MRTACTSTATRCTTAALRTEPPAADAPEIRKHRPSAVLSGVYISSTSPMNSMGMLVFKSAISQMNGRVNEKYSLA